MGSRRNQARGPRCFRGAETGAVEFDEITRFGNQPGKMELQRATAAEVPAEFMTVTSDRSGLGVRR
jgi:hypothetical protein